MADVEKLVQERRRFLWILLLTSAVWCGALALDESPWFSPGAHQLLSIIMVASILPWGVFLTWFVMWQRRMKAQPQVFAALTDEMDARNQLRALRASNTVLIVSLILGMGITAFVKISALPVLMGVVWVLTVSQLGFYLWFDRSE